MITDRPWIHRVYPAVVVLPDGRCLVVGESRVAEVYDPKARGVGRGDFDYDGRSDIYWHQPATGLTSIWHMEGLSASGGVTTHPHRTSGDPWHFEAIADIAGGGSTLVFWRNFEHYVGWGDPDTQPPWGTWGLPTQQPDWSIAATADFDGDGCDELLWRRTNGEIEMWVFFSGNSSQVLFRTFVADLDFVIAAVDDFDGDGKADVLWRHLVRGENYIWFMDATPRDSRTYRVARAGHTTAVPDMNYSIAGTGDFDGDGKADIVWRSIFGPTRIWFMNGVTIVNDVAVPAPGAGWSAAVIGDFDGDGKSDVFWRNATTGENAASLFDGYNVKASSSLPAVAAAGWITPAY